MLIRELTKLLNIFANDDLGAAEKWVNSYDSVERLKDFPNSGRIVAEVGKQYIREILFGNYRIVYRVEKKAINILTVRHGKQLLPIEDLSDK